MCGIAGFVHKGMCSPRCQNLEDQIHKLQACRGPDAQTNSTFVEADTVIHLYHQRLKIQDLSDQANQPMTSKDKSLTIVFNGEVYNVDDLKKSFLSNHPLITRSDTEVLVESLAISEMQSVLEKVRGMFAIGLLNRRNGVITLVRDRFGEKPIHYWHGQNQFFFASQYDSVVTFMNQFEIEVKFEQESIWSYLTFGYFSYDSSLVSGVQKIPPGGIVEVVTSSKEIRLQNISRWSPRWEAEGKEKFSMDALHETLQLAVREQLIGDVPVGVFMSGGSDSTLISALAQRALSQPIHSFSVGFENPKYDESRFALQAATEIGTHHHPFVMRSSDALDILENVLVAFPEPLGDPSVFPTTFVSREARKHVTVCLTGDGADELFFGYGRYTRFLQLQSLAKVPWIAGLVPLLKFSAKIASSSRSQSKFDRLSSALYSSAPFSIYTPLVGFPNYDVALNAMNFNNARLNAMVGLWRKGSSSLALDRLREIDLDSYLCDDILVKVDRAAMMFGLETRAPFLDYRVQKYARITPESWLHGVENKVVLKEILSKYVSSEVYRRPKMGFGAPLSDWFRCDLRDWVQSTISGTDWESLGIDHLKVREISGEIMKGNDSKESFFWSLCALGAASRRIKR